MAAAGQNREQRDALTEEAVRHINKQILDSYYIFKTEAPLKTYIREQTGSIREHFKLSEILTILKHIIAQNFLFDMRNPAIIVCDGPLETALGMKALHCIEIRELVYRQLIRVSEAQQRALRAAAPQPLPRPLPRGPPDDDNDRSTMSAVDEEERRFRPTPNLPSEVYLDIDARFEPSPALRLVLATRPTFDDEEVYYPFGQLTQWLSEYILAKKDQFFDTRNDKLAIVKDDPLGVAFKVDHVHRTQVTNFLKKCLRYISGSALVATTSKKHKYEE